MKIALCLYGIIGGDGGKSGIGSSDDVLRIGFEHYQDKIFANNDIDVFIHSWSVEHEKKIQDFYQPKSMIIEKQIYFNIPSYVCGDKNRKNNHYSRWYSTLKSVELKKQYEKRYGFKYDMVMLNRFDHMFRVNLKFNDYNSELFNVGKWCAIFFRGKDIYKGGSGNYYDVKYNKRDIEHKHKEIKVHGLLDWWFFSNSKNIDDFSLLYNYINEYTKPGNCPNDSSKRISNHKLAYYHLQKLNLTNTINHIMHSADDFGLVRRILLKCKK